MLTCAVKLAGNHRWSPLRLFWGCALLIQLGDKHCLKEHIVVLIRIVECPFFHSLSPTWNWRQLLASHWLYWAHCWYISVFFSFFRWTLSLSTWLGSAFIFHSVHAVDFAVCITVAYVLCWPWNWRSGRFFCWKILTRREIFTGQQCNCTSTGGTL